MNRKRRCAVLTGLTVLSGLLMLSGLAAFGQEIGPGALQQIGAITAAKANATQAQKKLDSNLMFSAMAARNDPALFPVKALIPKSGAGAGGNVEVEIYGNVTPALLDAVTAAGGSVLYRSPRSGILQASLPLGAMETVAARADVKTIQTALKPQLNGIGFQRLPKVRATPAAVMGRAGVSAAGVLTSQGFVSHAANTVVNNQGINGSGITVGVLSDSASAARIAALVASGDLPPTVSVLPGQAGTGTDEGTAMMEIIHDLAPGANLIFATAFNGQASFADNIIALQAAGCKVIVDDITYLDEGAFQDGPIAQAVNQVVANGAIYFSSAANSGNLTLGTSGTWEGDFSNGGVVSGVISAGGETGLFHNFGTVGSPQNYDVLTVASSFISLKWSDPLGASSNDYDLFILDSTGTTVKGFSAGNQTGTQDPVEYVYRGTGCGTAAASGYCPAAGDRIVAVLYSGTARALRVDTNRGQLSINTAGSTFGHNAGLNTVSTAASYWNSAHSGTRPFTGALNPIETFSSDGPRKIFYNPNGSAITPGNFLFGTNGGITLQKPDLTAADGVSAKTPGFNQFFGTSAAAPHAAAIAALVRSVQPSWTPAQVKAAMLSATVDNMAPGVDRDSGYGIVMATLAIQAAMQQHQ